MRLFWDRGYDAVGVAELGDAIGIKPPSLYQAFGSKHGLFELAVCRYVDGEGNFLDSALTGAGTLHEAVRRTLVQAAIHYTRPRKPRGCLVLDGARNCNDEQARATTGARRLETRAYLAGVLERLAAEHPRRTADYVMIAMSGLSAAAREGTRRAVLVESAECFADGIAPSTGGRCGPS